MIPEFVSDEQWLRLERYMAGKASPGEEVLLARELGCEPEEHPTVRALRAELWASQRRSEGVDSTEALRGLRARLAKYDEYEGVRRITPSRVRERSSRTNAQSRQIARVGLGVVTTVIAIMFVFVLERMEGTSTSSRVYATRAGQRATVTLADGSRAILGPATILAVAQSPTQKSIVVTVDGQALFAVTPNARSVFAVYAGGVVTRVLGTTFGVQRYATDHTTRVMVFDGRVSVQQSAESRTSGNPSSLILSSRMAAWLPDSGQLRVARDVTVDTDTAWTTGELVFQKAAVPDVVAELGRAYGVEIRLADSTLDARRLTWTVSTGRESLTDVLNELPILLNVHIVQSGQTITIVPGRQALRRPAARSSLLTQESQYGR